MNKYTKEEAEALRSRVLDAAKPIHQQDRRRAKHYHRKTKKFKQLS